ncbi:Aerobic respiration control sensor protein ArcB [Achromobacter spanius]|uniref:CheR family methyltransferase n=1 Tax=Achromobacter spanius TaxID=217203 RepID=UPI000C2B66E8|nr:CheR family methyltransferase [Achromobacter spanius]AUA59108.1 chemotaxis protein [Achromobacter spanius]CAB3707261.1 Sensor histidine kinase RcsC [Achromobacter spanius]SPT40536.1 Aerobic respiration control sensor protein ArcB [Achromobacter denitrificans]VEE58708.1 Aerobic respiration control sensor protein ArcB [Achromobacter spanius]
MSNTPFVPDNKPGVAISDLHFPVVGLGASAGGIEALRDFFSHTSSNPMMAFVVIVHLSPDHESVLDRILQAATGMPVVQVTHPQRIQCNHVYVIPPASVLAMNDGYLSVKPTQPSQGSRVAIDEFFRTLADVHTTRAVGIVLTGGGSDGSLGLARIKEQGGVTFAQQPDDAEHDAMPRSAIATGMVDIILPIAAMPERLKQIADNMSAMHVPRLAKDNAEAAGASTPGADPDKEDRIALRDILTVLRARTAHDFRHYKTATVLRRIERRMQVTGVSTLRAYWQLLQDRAEETPLLLSDMLIGVTQFFRDKDAFSSLENFALGKLFERHQKNPGSPLRAWVAGCSTGEEAYSLAVLLSARADALKVNQKIQVFATDIDEAALAVGRAGSYPTAIETDVPKPLLEGYFSRQDNEYRIKKEVRERVLFAVHNILRDPPFSKLDLVSCRNLLIYLDRDVQQDVLKMFHFALKPGGYLFLGSSESADACPRLFQVVDKRNRIYVAKETPTQLRNVPALPAAHAFERPSAAPANMARNRHNKISYAEVHQRALEMYAPPSVIVDAESDIVHMSERAGRFLRHAGGEPSRNLPSLVHPELRMELRTAMFQALHTRKSVEARRVKMKIGERQTYVNMVVRPFRHEETSNDYMLVLFDEVEDVMSPEGVAPTVGASAVMTQLEAELQGTKDQLQTTIEQSQTSTEELKASNEELQAINEELRSATEELETGKEELQSVNEELITVNAELKAKVDETAKINDDLQNLIASTDIATLFVDRKMHIQWFTPRAADVFNVITSDAGRSLLDITHRLDYPDMARDAAGVFESLRAVEREVRSDADRWYLARLLPYRSAEHRIEGAVLTFIDITDRRKAEDRVRLGEAHLKLMTESARDFGILTLDPDGVITNWNIGAETMFGYSRAEAVGKSFSIIFTDADIQAGRPQLELERARQIGYAPDERWHRRKDGGLIFCTGGVNRMDDPTIRGFAKIVRDVTDLKLRDAEQESRLDRARADNVLKDEFFAMVSHELKHPLNLIQLNAELLARTPAVRNSPAAARSADLIQRSVKGQARIIDDLLDLSRVRTGKLALSQSIFDVTAITTNILDVLRPVASAAGLTLHSEFDANQAIHLNADPLRVEQIIWNLLNNGIKFTPPGGSVTLKLAVEDSRMRLDVIDTGHGIDPSFLGKVFDMFSQADVRQRNLASPGLGIGLAVASELVKAHGGTIQAHSDGQGHGARFTVRMALAHAQQEEQQLPLPGESPLKGMKVLIVDDSEDILHIMRELLDMEEACVTAVGSGREALDALEASAFDLLLSDIGMPGMDGYALIRAVREKYPDLAMPAIALTGFGSKDDMNQALQAGYTAHISKPVSLDNLLDIVRRLREQA